MYTTINKKENKLLYFFDKGIDRFVSFLLTLIRFFVPGHFKIKIDKVALHKDMLHNVVGLTFFNALGGLCLMATQVKLANYLGASVYGVYAYYIAIGEIGAMFVRYGRNKTMVRDLIQMPEKRDELVVNTFFLSLINLALFLLITCLCHQPLDIDVSWTSFLLILSPCFISLSLGPIYESLQMMSWHSIYALIQKFLFLAIFWLLLLWKIKISLFAIGVIIVCSWLIVGFLEYHEIISQLHINFFQNVKFCNIWDLYKDNFVIFLSCATGVAFGPLLQMILNNYTDSTSVGIYAAGLQIYHICLFLNTQISRIGNPMMAQAGRDDCPTSKRKQLVSKYLIVMFVASLPFALPMLLFPHFLTNIFYTEEYVTLAKYLPILGVYMIAITIGVVFTQYLISMREDKIYFTIYVASAVATVLVAYWLIPIYGLLGAFLALCIPQSIGCFLYFVSSLKSLRV